ncbi:DNA-binding response regulator [Micromonospora acroterricola]|uniref:DNA-binding response regulator n=1 Tax=Micromonospora acroterricola TaxID=2202421 RepID=A0A317D909_9ACTN|nr:response regulator transcription factor [Micromonospora acroterricola]PWR10772.1 DNA-binding response regulator [Micromonospora acroterricola]
MAASLSSLRGRDPGSSSEAGPRSVVRVAVVGAPGLLRGVLVSVLDAAADFAVVGEVDPSGDVSGLAGDRAADLVLADLDVLDDLPALMARLRVDAPGCVVVLLTGRRTPRMLRRALRDRVRGVIAKDVPPSDLLCQLRAVARGQRRIDPLAALAAIEASVNPLTDREREVAAAAARGLRSKEIAEALFLAPGTVRNHMSTLLRKTGARNRWEAVRRAQDAGWI